MANSQKIAYMAALQWHMDNGAVFPWTEAPSDKTALSQYARLEQSDVNHQNNQTASVARLGYAASSEPTQDIEGTARWREEAIKSAAAATTHDELREAIAAFHGLAIKKTATNMVFCDGNPKARIMIVGEAPGADEDRQGKPFVGKSGQLLDRILGSIGLDRHNEDTGTSVYISNILNWRPPGNRTPTPSEIDIALPFIEKHIALTKPEILILCGGVAAKSLLNSTNGITKLRGKWTRFVPQTQKKDDFPEIQALATFHPSYLLRNPAQKKAVWQDMLALKARLNNTD